MFVVYTELYTILYTELFAELNTELSVDRIGIICWPLLSLISLQCLIDLVKHKVDEWTRLPCVGAGRDGIIIGLLVGIDHVLYWQVLKQRMQFAKYE